MKGYWSGSVYYGWDPDAHMYRQFPSDEEYWEWYTEMYED